MAGSDAIAGTAQYIADQQGNFAVEIHRMQNQMRQTGTALEELRAEVRRLAAAEEQRAGDLRRIESALREMADKQALAREDLAAIKAALGSQARSAA